MNHPSLEPHENYAALQDLIAHCKAYLEWPAEKLFEIKPDVSGWPIAFHLYHLARAHGPIPGLLERLKTGRLGEEDLTGEPEKLQFIYDGVIPRGWQSPETTRPPVDLDHALLVKDFDRMATATLRIEPLLDDLEAITFSFPHIYFGPLNALEWLRFTHIHTRHHLGIIREIEAG